MSSTETEVAVLFSDVVGSSRLYERLGDHAAREMILACVNLMREATERNRGTVIKTIGDEILAIFPTPDDAVNAASEMQQDVVAQPALVVDGQHVAIRIGCHFGPVVFDNKDIFGTTVHTANRLTSQSKARQIILAADTVGRLAPEWRAVCRQVDVTSVRGVSEDMQLFEVLWQQEDVTSQLPSIEIEGRRGHRAKRVRLHYQGRDFVVDDAKKLFTMGRADENDIVMRGALISRLHAKIEVTRDKFLLVDQSTNGTFVVNEEGRESFVRRDGLPLAGGGLIGLGKLPEANAPDAIRYRLED